VPTADWRCCRPNCLAASTCWRSTATHLRVLRRGRRQQLHADAHTPGQAQQLRLACGQAAPEGGVAALDDQHGGAVGEAQAEQLRPDDLREARPQVQCLRIMLRGQLLNKVQGSNSVIAV